MHLEDWFDISEIEVGMEKIVKYGFLVAGLSLGTYLIHDHYYDIMDFLSRMKDCFNFENNFQFGYKFL